jgi:hypothetical protein
MKHIFAAASEDQTWIGGRTPRLVECRNSAGIARCDVHDGALTIDASDELPADLAALLDDALTSARAGVTEVVEELLEEFPAARVRSVISARHVQSEPELGAPDWRVEETRIDAAITTSLPYSGAHVSVVSSARDALFDAAALARLTADRPEVTGENAGESLPIVWRDGSGAVLLHEAIGHAAEYAMAPLVWPSWLSVIDDPEGTPFGAMPFDDAGQQSRRVSLLREAPAMWRRGSFRDVPQRRMSALLVTQRDAPFTLPDERVEVWRTGRGALEPLTGLVTLEISIADLVGGNSRRRLAPFVLRATREELAGTLAGASGEAMRYPGVICSAEGQELPVGSFAPLLLTRRSRA